MKINKKTNFILFSLLFLVFLIGAGFVLAKDLEVDYPLFEKAPKLTEKSTLTDYIGYLFNFVIWASGFIILGVLIYSGILYLISAGDPGKKNEARSRIINGFVGIIIILSSYLILTTISPSLVMVHLTTEGIKITEPGEKPEPNTPEEEKKTITLFQVPSGKIVERLVLDDKAAEFLGTNDEPLEQFSPSFNNIEQIKQIYNEFQKREYLNSVFGQAQKTKDLSILLLILSNELKKETDKCNCGQTKKCPTPTPPCKGEGCKIDCNYEKIKELKNQVRDVAEALLAQQEKVKEKQLALLKENQTSLIEKVVQLKQPSFLVSLMAQQTEGITDYKTMLTQKHFLNEQQMEVKTETFDYWKDPGENADDTSDDSLVMDVRTGFKERKDMPPTFDPATLYFERNKKTNVFIASAELIDFEKLKSYIEEGLKNREFTDKEYSVEDVLNGIFNNFERDPKDIKDIIEKIFSLFGFKRVEAETRETIIICDVEIPIGESMDTTYDFLIELIEEHQKLYEAIPKQVKQARSMADSAEKCDTEEWVKDNCEPVCGAITTLLGLPACEIDPCVTKFLPFGPLVGEFKHGNANDINDACPTKDINDAWGEEKEFAFSEKLKEEDEEKNQNSTTEPEEEKKEFVYGGVIGSSANILALIKGKDTINEDSKLDFLIEERDDREESGEKSRIIKIDKTVPIDENIKTPEEKKKEEGGEKLEGIPLLQYIDRKLRVARQEFNECALTPEEISALQVRGGEVEEWPRTSATAYDVINEGIYRLPERLADECIEPCAEPGSQECFRCRYKSLLNYYCCH